MKKFLPLWKNINERKKTINKISNISVALMSLVSDNIRWKKKIPDKILNDESI